MVWEKSKTIRLDAVDVPDSLKRAEQGGRILIGDSQISTGITKVKFKEVGETDLLEEMNEKVVQRTEKIEEEL